MKQDELNIGHSRFVPRSAKTRGGLLALGVSVFATVSLSAAPSGRRIFIGNDGKLQGVANGYSWVAGGEGTNIASPSPCNTSGCFKDTGGQLCTKGTIPALSCTGQGTPQYACNWDKNWGLVLGFNVTQPEGPWGYSAPKSVAVEYTSAAQAGSAGHFRLNAHVAGDPHSKQYCVDYYTPGAVVQPSDMKSKCWYNAGETLTNFNRVDQIGLLRVPENKPLSFDFCITGIITY
jgi:hypothetical protein